MASAQLTYLFLFRTDSLLNTLMLYTINTGEALVPGRIITPPLMLARGCRVMQAYALGSVLEIDCASHILADTRDRLLTAVSALLVGRPSSVTSNLSFSLLQTMVSASLAFYPLTCLMPPSAYVCSSTPCCAY